MTEAIHCIKEAIYKKDSKVEYKGVLITLNHIYKNNPKILFSKKQVHEEAQKLASELFFGKVQPRTKTKGTRRIAGRKVGNIRYIL